MMRWRDVWRIECAGDRGDDAAALAEIPTDYLLPSDFPVYVFDGGVVNHPVPGSRRVVLPTVNRYDGPGGGYVACFPPPPRQRVLGGWRHLCDGTGACARRLRRPHLSALGHRGRDISAAPEFKQICGDAIAACRAGACWAGGDTGGWFGLK